MVLASLALTGCPASAPYEESRLLMDTVVRIEAYGPRAREAVEAAFAEFTRLDQLWNPYDEESELARINRAAGRGPVAASPDTLRVLETALEVAARTGGAFDPTIGPLVRLWGFGEQAAPQPPAPTAIARERALVDYRLVRLDAGSGTVELPRAGMALDLGAIAKGYAVDRARAIMQQYGVSRALITAGGCVYGLGNAPGNRPWRVAVQHPRDSRAILGIIPVRDLAVDTSGDYQRFFEADGTRYHHVLDPRTGYPARACQSATVLHPSAQWADALATACMVLGPERALALVETVPGAALLLVDERGQLHRTPDLPWEEASHGR